MAEENVRADVAAPAGGPAERAAKVKERNTLWWGILAVYMLLFVVTGYIAFFARDENPALDERTDERVARITDEATRSFVIQTLQSEAADHQKKTDLASQSFNVVLGSLLGFLSASAVTRPSSGKSGG
ncbi:MAG TPA: hypothetical protein VEQ42_13075 [Pyrinomonadaceae bacterium]|nr:hypothetical protein [Pyrinomonadaceae bacterium]